MHDYRIVRTEQEHIESLRAIELAAAAIFDDGDLPATLRGQTVPTQTFLASIQQDCLWVALSPENKPAGFALTSLHDESVHLEEMDVHPMHARRGIGRALVQTICDRAREQGFETVTLTTFRHLAWNAPFYARLGFVSLDENEFTPMLRERLQCEAQVGLTKRTAMQIKLT
jgi:GNAT superfamily N-acetyltransferase